MLMRTLVFIHVLAALTFFMGHGASVMMAIKLRKETDLARIRAMLDLSSSSLFMSMVGLAVLGLTGLIMPFIAHLWGRLYLWLSILLIMGTIAYMGIYNEKGYKILRKKVGLPYMRGMKGYPPEPPADQAVVVGFIQTLRVEGLFISGYVIPAIVLGLMIFKPF